MAIPKDVFLDDLTGVYNRRYLLHWIDGEIKKSRRYRLPFSIVLLDLDDFKEVNDVHGHLKGDLILKLFAQYLKGTLREADIITRYGGDEFIALLPNTPREQAQIVAERIIDQAKRQSFSGIKLSASAGIATFPIDGETWEELFRVADRRLYSAKRKGKGSVGVIGEELGELMIPTPHLIDRKNEMKEIERHILDSSRGLFIVGGGAGVGKTRLVKDVVSSMPGLVLFTGHSYATMHSSPYFAIRDLFSNIIQTHEDEVRDVYVNDLNIQQKREISRIIPIVSGYLEPLVGDKFMLFESIQQFLISLSKRIKFALLFDDLHWASESTIELLYYLIKTLQDIPIFGTYRIEEIHQTPLEETIRILGRERLYKLLMLEPLERIYTKEMVEVILQGLASNELVEYVYRESGGNPFFIEEILKELHKSQALNKTGDAWFISKRPSISIPKSIEDTVLYKLQLLNDERRRIVEIAACIGRDFSFPLLLQISGYNEGELYDILDELVSLGLLREIIPNSRYYFTEDAFRQVVYTTIPRGKRMKTHMDIANIIEHHFREIPYWHEQLAYHYFMGGEKKKLLEFAIQAGMKAKEVYAHEEALKFFSWALQGEIPREKRVEVLLMMGEVSVLKGDYRNAISFLEEAVSLASGALKGECYQKLGWAFAEMGDYSNALKVLRKGRKLFTDKNKKLITDIEIAWTYKGLGKMESAHRKIASVMEKLDKEKFGHEYSRALTIHAILHADEKDYKSAMKYYHEAMELKQKLNDRIGIAHIYLDAGIIYANQDDYEMAENYYSKALEIYIETGYKSGEASALNNLGSLYLRMNLIHKAEEHFRKALRIAEWVGDISNKLLLLRNLGFIMYVNDFLDEAAKFYNQALNIARENNNNEWIIRLLASLINLNIEGFHNFDEAEKLMNEAKSMFPQIEDKLLKSWIHSLEVELILSKVEEKPDTNAIEKAIYIIKDKVLPEAQKSKSRYSLLEAYSKLARCYAFKKWDKWGERYVKRCLKEAEKEVDRSVSADAYFYAGEFYRILGNKKKAGVFYRKAQEIYREFDFARPVKVIEEKLKLLSKKKKR